MTLAIAPLQTSIRLVLEAFSISACTLAICSSRAEFKSLTFESTCASIFPCPCRRCGGSSHSPVQRKVSVLNLKDTCRRDCEHTSKSLPDSRYIVWLLSTATLMLCALFCPCGRACLMYWFGCSMGCTFPIVGCAGLLARCWAVWRNGGSSS